MEQKESGPCDSSQWHPDLCDSWPEAFELHPLKYFDLLGPSLSVCCDEVVLVLVFKEMKDLCWERLQYTRVWIHVNTFEIIQDICGQHLGMERSPSMRWWSRFFLVRTRHSGACTEMGLFDIFCVSPDHLQSVDFLRFLWRYHIAPGAVQEWAKLSLAAESNGRYQCCFSCAVECTRSSEIIKFEKTKRYKNMQKHIQISSKLYR